MFSLKLVFIDIRFVFRIKIDKDCFSYLFIIKNYFLLDNIKKLFEFLSKTIF